MVAQLLTKKFSEWDSALKCELDWWTANISQRVYGFLRGGEGLTFETDQFINGKFSNPLNHNNGFVISKCKDAWAHRVLENLVPILYPKSL